jgi:hypothetical protein
MFEALERHAVEYVVIGGTAAVIHGATHLTFDLDITPARERQNLERLAAALKDLGARPFGIPDDALQSFQLDGETLHNGSAWTFITEHGELDVALDPDGTQGYRDLIRDAREADAYGLLIRVASLADVIRSKEAANRDRDRAVLPDLRRTLELQRLRESR